MILLYLPAVLAAVENIIPEFMKEGRKSRPKAANKPTKEQQVKSHKELVDMHDWW